MESMHYDDGDDEDGVILGENEEQEVVEEYAPPPTRAHKRRRGGKIRAIIHLDVNAFYASVECARLWPKLEGLPVAVSQRALLVTTNYVARDRGVPKMCSVAEGKRVCPDLVVIESDMARYRDANRALMAILSEFVTDIEKASIDEAYLDVTAQCVEAREMMRGLQASQEDLDELRRHEGILLGSFEDEDDALLQHASRIALLIRMELRV